MSRFEIWYQIESPRLGNHFAPYYIMNFNLRKLNGTFGFFLGFALILIATLVVFKFSTSAHRKIAEVSSCEILFCDENEFTTRHDFLSGKYQISDKVKAFSYVLPDNTYLTFVNMGLIDPFSVEAKSAQNYLAHRAEVFRERLSKYQEKDQDSLEKSVRIEAEILPRSFIILNTEGPVDHELGSHEFLAGARVVFARSEFEKLPYQLDPELTTLKLERKNPKVWAAEVGGLLVTAKGNANKSVELINAAIQVALSYSNIWDVYVHTSKIHARMYRRMSLAPEEITIIDNLNYILRYDLKDWGANHLLSTKPATSQGANELQQGL